MNKILVVNDEIKEKQVDDKIIVSLDKKQSLFEINAIKLDILSTTDILLDINVLEPSKLQFDININKDANVNLYIKTSGDKGKIKYNYFLEEHSNTNIIKYNKIATLNEMVEINLNGIYAQVDYLFKSICKSKECYDYAIFHNAKNTSSNIKNNGVNISGVMNIQISSAIPKNIIDCTCNQYNRIINLTNNKCEIRPILYIDNDQVDANHSALIGDFENEELFYLETMGISKLDAYNLLVRGFLLNGINFDLIKQQIEEDINKYWR